jgi:hypothetical protein
VIASAGLIAVSLWLSSFSSNHEIPVESTTSRVEQAPASESDDAEERFRRAVVHDLARLEPNRDRGNVRLASTLRPSAVELRPALREQVEPPERIDLDRPPPRTARAAERPRGDLRRAPAVVADPERYASANWDYLNDVFDGRVSGIPSEAKAGVSLPDIDALGEVPILEQLREEERFDELADLGLDPGTVAWPVCLRTGTCRRDGNSSPP